MHFTQNSSNKQTPETNTVQASTENPALSLRYGMRRSLRRTFFRPECQSRGWGICKVCTAWGPGIYQPRGHAQAFDLPAVSYQNITTQKVLLKKMQIGSSVKDRNKLKRVVKACSQFYACISSLLIKQEFIHSEDRSCRCESTFFGYWIKFLLILFEEHPFIFIKLFITYNVTALY